MQFRHLPMCLLPPASPERLDAMLSGVAQAGWAGPILLWPAAEPAGGDGAPARFAAAIPHGVAMPPGAGRAPGEAAEAWAFVAQRREAALFVSDIPPPGAFDALAALHAAAGPRVAALESGGVRCLFRAPWLACRRLWRDFLACDGELAAVALWYGRLGWPPLPAAPDMARAALWNTLGLARLGPEDAWAQSERELDALVAQQRQALLRHRLAADAFAGSAALIDALRLLRALDAAALLPGDAAGRLTASGFYPDGWSHPRAGFAFPPGTALRAVTLEAIAAQHLPPGATLELALNGKLAAAVALAPGEPFATTVLAPARLDGLEKRLTAHCSVASDPRSAGFNEDRRQLGFLLVSLTLEDAEGVRVALTAAEALGRPAAR